MNDITIAITGDNKRKKRLDEQLVKFTVRQVNSSNKIIVLNKSGMVTDSWARKQAITRGLTVEPVTPEEMVRKCDLLVVFARVRQETTWDITRKVIKMGKIVHAHLKNKWHDKWKTLWKYHLDLHIKEW